MSALERRRSNNHHRKVQVMITAFEIVMFVVTALAVAACFTRFFSIRRAVASLGRQGAFWFEHEEDREVEERPNEDGRDAPLPRRQLRARH
jgi:hypothetical protein